MIRRPDGSYLLMTLPNKISFVLVCTTLLLSAVAYGTVHQPIIALFYIVTASLILLWAYETFRTGEVHYNASYLQLPLYAAVVYGVIQIIPFGSIAEVAGVAGVPRTISLYPFATQLATVHFFALAVFFSVTLCMLDSARRIRNLVVVIMVFGFAYAFFAILQSVLSPDKIYGIYEARSGSPFGSFVNRHNFAAYMEMTLALPLGLMFAGAVPRDKRLLYATAIALMGVALLLSGSRGGLVSFLAQIFLLVILTVGLRSRSSMLLRVGLAAALIAAIVGGSFFVGGESSLTRIAETAESGDVTTDRAHIWRVTVDVIANNLPLGAGLGAFGIAYTVYDSYSGLERVEQAHNDYLQVIADAGIVGAIIGAIFLFLLIREGIRTPKISNTYRRGVAIGAFSGIFAILVHSIFDFVLHTTAITLLFLALVSLLVASRYRYDDDVTDEHADRRGHPAHRRSSPAATSSIVARFRH